MYQEKYEKKKYFTDKEFDYNTWTSSPYICIYIISQQLVKLVYTSRALINRFELQRHRPTLKRVVCGVVEGHLHLLLSMLLHTWETIAASSFMMIHSSLQLQLFLPFPSHSPFSSENLGQHWDSPSLLIVKTGSPTITRSLYATNPCWQGFTINHYDCCSKSSVYFITTLVETNKS